MHQSHGEGAERQILVWKPSRSKRYLKPGMLPGSAGTGAALSAPALPRSSAGAGAGELGGSAAAGSAPGGGTSAAWAGGEGLADDAAGAQGMEGGAGAAAPPVARVVQQEEAATGNGYGRASDRAEGQEEAGVEGELPEEEALY
jgi:hypothetical protein